MASRTRGGFDVDLMSTALSITNGTKQRAGEEAAQMAEEPLEARKKAAGSRLGKLYTFGSGENGRLGHGDNVVLKEPKLVEILRDKDIKKFASGEKHSVALTADGHVFTWGHGGDGQLGLSNYQVQTMPAMVKGLQGENVIDIVCGEKHTVALTAGGDVFAWGDNTRGQVCIRSGGGQAAA